MEWEQYQKQCFLLARKQEQYLKDQSFNDRILQLLSGIPETEKGQAIAFLESMVSHSQAYTQMEEKYLPILIYKAEPTCYGILNDFADVMCRELEQLGECVEIFDAAQQPLDELRVYAKKKYKAVLGIQTYLFSIQTVQGKNLHDYFDAPLYNLLLDHPVVMHKHWIHAPKRMTVLTHDRNYLHYLQKYYPDVVSAQLLAPGGESYPGMVTKEYELSFVGSYRNWLDWAPDVKRLNRKYHGIVRRVICEMKHHPNDTYEAVVERVWLQYGVSLSLYEQREFLYECRETYYCVMNFYRSKIIMEILDAGMVLDVFGDSWKVPLFAGYSNLRIHEEVSGQEALEVYAASKISLNIMSWHKAGMTERIANMMLCKTVVLSDWSEYLEGHFMDGQELILFDLTRIPELPGKIRSLLQEPEQLAAISEAGYRIAWKEHTWTERAKEFLEMVN